MKFGVRAFALALLMMAGATAASADTLQLVNGGNYSMGGVDVGPYNFTGNIGGQTVNLQLICDNFTAEVTSGESWSVNVSPLPTPYGTLGTAAQYQEVAYLAQLIFGLNPNSSGYGQTLGELQWAVWNIFDPGVGLSSANPDPYGTLTSLQIMNIQKYVTQAVDNAGSGNYSNLLVYTPIPNTQEPNPPNTGIPQEYVGEIVTTPEPGLPLLLGAGLASLMLIRRRVTA